MKTRLQFLPLAITILALALMVLVTTEAWTRTVSPSDLSPIAVNGVLDLRNWDGLTDGVLHIRGDWEFYWNALFSPSDLLAGAPGISGYSDVGFWNDYVVDGEPLPGQGYATYALTILVEPNGQRMALRIPAQSTAFRLYMNGRELASNGTVGTSAETSVPQYMPTFVEFYNDSPEINLVLQVSNFHHRYGGMEQPLEIGLGSVIRTRATRLILVDLCSMGSMFSMGFYHVLLYLMRKKDRSTIYFAGICACYGIRSMTIGEVALTKIWPRFDWATLLKLGYVTSAGILPLVLLFLRELYEEETSKTVVKAGVVHFALLIPIVLLAPTTLTTQIIVYYQIVSAALSSYVFYVLVSASIRRREGALWLSISALFFLVTLLNDLLYINGVIHTMTLSSFGLVVVCFGQAQVLAARFSHGLSAVEALRDQLAAVNQQLTDLNRGLEIRVNERTAALVESNKRLEAINAEIERMEKSRKHLLANIAHDLRTPVTLIQGYVEAMLDGVIEDPQELHKYLNLIAGKAAGLSHLIADLFELTQLESRRVTFDLWPVPIADLVRGLYLKYEGDISFAGMIPVLEEPDWKDEDGPEAPTVIADAERIDRVFANLIYNALKFTPEGGSITVRYGLTDPEDSGAEPPRPRFAVVSITDTGAGIAKEDLPYVFDRFYKVPRARSQALGSGLGLSIAREIVELHGGRIWAESAPGQGGTFSFTLRLDA